MSTAQYTDFFLRSKRNVARLELLEISHPSFSKTYRLVRNKLDGVTVQHEDGSAHTYEYYPLRITENGASDDLDSSLNIDLGDLGDIVASEADNVAAAGTFGTKPTVVLRLYRSDQLTSPMYGPFHYEAGAFVLKREGTSFSANAPALNVVVTGERYLPNRFPMLRAFL